MAGGDEIELSTQLRAPNCPRLLSRGKTLGGIADIQGDEADGNVARRLGGRVNHLYSWSVVGFSERVSASTTG